jgi:hypothetical protein
MRHETRRPQTRSRHAGGISAACAAQGARRREAVGGGEVAGDEPHVDLSLAEGCRRSRQRRARAGRSPGHGSTHQAHAHAAGASVSLDQRQGSPAVRPGLRVVDSPDHGHADRAEVRRQPGAHGRGQIAGSAGPDAAKAPATRLSKRPASHRALAARDLPGYCSGGAAERSRCVLLGRVGVSGRHRARQDLGTQRQDPRRPAPRATPVDLGGLGRQPTKVL